MKLRSKRHNPPPALLFTLLDTPAYGGAEQYLLQQLIPLAKLKHHVVVATNHPQVASLYRAAARAEHLKHFQVIDAPYRLDAIGNWKGLLKFWFSLPKALGWAWQTLNWLPTQVQAGTPVICYWPGWTDRLVFSPLAKRLGFGLIWIEIGPLEPLFRRNWGFPWVLHRLMHTLPDQVITTSDWTRRSLIKTGKIPNSKISLIYPGITHFSARQLTQFQRHGQIWRDANLKKSTKLIGWVGRLAKENELDILIDAVGHLVRQTGRTIDPLLNFKVVIIGDGPDRDFYQARVAQHGLTDHFIWTGFIDEQDKFARISVCDGFVFTRSWDLDGFGMTTIEAMAVGVPVITSRFGPQLEIVTHDSNGLLFAPHQPKSLSVQLRRLLSDGHLRRRLSQTASHTVKQFHHTHHLKAVRKVLETLT